MNFRILKIPSYSTGNFKLMMYLKNSIWPMFQDMKHKKPKN